MIIFRSFKRSVLVLTLTLFPLTAVQGTAVLTTTVTIFPLSLESPLNKLCLDSLIYNDVKVEEPFDCLPSTSLIIQVSSLPDIKMYAISVCRKCYVMLWFVS